VIEVRPAGLYCVDGNFYIDPWEEVERAVITHAHSDHARPGSKMYLTTRAGEPLLRARVGPEASIQAVNYGERIVMDGVTVSLHPAGHILGSAQVRIEHRGEVWVVSGDYKLAPDPTCAPFELLLCDTFVTESTFALPIFRWPAEQSVVEGIEDWWRMNQQAGKTSVLFAYPLGKAQRVLAALGDSAIGPIYAHASIEGYNRLYREQGIALGITPSIALHGAGEASKQSLILAPPSVMGSAWLKPFGTISTAMVSGWMRIRGTRRRRSLDRGFVLSDHADWPALLRAIDETRAETVWVTHGYRAPLTRWLEEHGRRAVAVETPHQEDGE
jgi:putative mRNA 3-end processing factor